MVTYMRDANHHEPNIFSLSSLKKTKLVTPELCFELCALNKKS